MAETSERWGAGRASVESSSLCFPLARDDGSCKSSRTSIRCRSRSARRAALSSIASSSLNSSSSTDPAPLAAVARFSAPFLRSRSATCPATISSSSLAFLRNRSAARPASISSQSSGRSPSSQGVYCRCSGEIVIEDVWETARVWWEEREV